MRLQLLKFGLAVGVLGRCVQGGFLRGRLLWELDSFPSLAQDQMWACHFSHLLKCERTYVLLS